MRIGVMIFPTDRAMPPDELATEVEARGFASLYVPEHTHIPVDHSPYPAGGELPEMYKRTLDPFVALSAAAAVTTDLRLGTGICLVAQHHPIDLAKQVASLDHLSGGRVDFGIGYGWDVPETEHHGVAFSDRRAFVHESVEAMKALWTEEEASFAGEHVSFGPSYAWPKPVQDPHPPVLLGAALGPKAKAALVEHCDGWMPIGGRGLKERIPEVRAALEEAGRDPDAFRFHVYGSTPDVDQVRYFGELGVHQTSFWLPPAGRDEVIPALDAYARIAEAVA
ncbi:MAG: LLM class F420-dependent oxidoreductase [Actinobacteria bacterium]|nr:LLM class F420-dependent oxidoreductase [Actinomycetota bacterium]